MQNRGSIEDWRQKPNGELDVHIMLRDALVVLFSCRALRTHQI